MNDIVTIVATMQDGSTVQLFPVQAPASITEVDVHESDGSTKKFVPAP